MERFRIDWPPDHTAKRLAELATTSEETCGLPRPTLEEALQQLRVEGLRDRPADLAVTSKENARIGAGD